MGCLESKCLLYLSNLKDRDITRKFLLEINLKYKRTLLVINMKIVEILSSWDQSIVKVLQLIYSRSH